MEIKNIFKSLNPKLINEIQESGNIVDIVKNTEVMREGQFVKAIPFVTKGLIKVFSRYDEKELLLYYIRPGESCIMSFDACMRNSPSKIYASTEENSSVLLLPVDKVFNWMREYPEMNSLFFQQYNIRYNELIHMVNELLFEKLDQRLYKYLKRKSEIAQKNPIKISHRKIANEMGTAREVISRVVKKLEIDGKILQISSGIKIL